MIRNTCSYSEALSTLLHAVVPVCNGVEVVLRHFVQHFVGGNTLLYLFEPDNPRTWESICVKCNMARILACSSTDLFLFIFFILFVSYWVHYNSLSCFGLPVYTPVIIFLPFPMTSVGAARQNKIHYTRKILDLDFTH